MAVRTSRSVAERIVLEKLSISDGMLPLRIPNGILRCGANVQFHAHFSDTGGGRLPHAAGILDTKGKNIYRGGD